MKTLGAAGVEVFPGQNGTVREAVERYKDGNLESTRNATVKDHHGMGAENTEDKGSGNHDIGNTEKASPGSNRGMGGGMGRGMGGGKGRGMGGGMQGGNPAQTTSEASETNQLREQIKQLKEQIKILESKLDS